MIAKLAICQPGYPQKIVYNGDTLIAITPTQMIKMNNLYGRYKECQDINTILQSGIDSSLKAFSLYDSTEKNLKQQISIKDNAIQERDSVLKQSYVVQEYYKKEIKHLKRRNTIICTVAGVFSGIIVLLSIL